jgi:hypothetical protein
MMMNTTSQVSAPNMIPSWRLRLDALFSSPDRYTLHQFHIMKTMITNTDGKVLSQ